MRSSKLLMGLLCWCGTTNAQNASNDTAAQHITLDTLTVSAPAGLPPYQGAAARIWEIKNTRIALTFNWSEKTADAKEWIKMHPYCYGTDTIVLDAKGVRIDSVQLVSKKGNTNLQYKYADDELRIKLGQNYIARDTVELYIKYTSMPYASASDGSRAITEDRGLYFINSDNKIPNKQPMIWTQGETESNSHWLITIDKPNSRFTTQVELTVPDSMVSLGNGALVKQVKGINGTRTDIWKMDMPIQAYAVMFAISKFAVVKDHYKTKEVNYYVEPAFAPYARLMFNHTAEMMEFFSQTTGVPYPWNKYSQVVVRDYVSGAMENTTASLFGEFMNQNAREIADKNSEDVVSHELFHQWFGDYVTAESWSNLTVNESFANYGEQLWRAHEYGKESADELAYNDLQGYLGSSLFNDPQLVRYTYDNREEMFDAISYNKGGSVLRYLHHLLGDEAFSLAMKLYLTKNALHSAEAQNWRMAIEEATGQDWNWFFNQWYYHAGHPALKVVYDYNDTIQKLLVTVSQTQSDSSYNYTLPLKAALAYGNDKQVTDWNITRRREVYSYPYKNGVKPLLVPDYTHVLPGDIKENKKPEQWMAQLTICDDYISKRLAVSAGGKQLSDSVNQLIIDMALNDKLVSIRRQALSYLKTTQSDKYRRRWNGKIVAMATGDNSKLVRADAYSILGEWKVAAAKESMIMAVNDSSYAMAGAALDAINKLDKDTAYVLARKIVDTHPKSSLENATWVIIGKKGTDNDAALYVQYMPYVLGQKKFAYAQSINNYLKAVKSDASFAMVVDVFANMVINDNMKAVRSAMAGYFFQAAAEQKENIKSENKEDAETARRRLAILKTAGARIVAREADPEAVKNFSKMMKDNFE